MGVELVRDPAIVERHRRLLPGPGPGHDGQQRAPGRRARRAPPSSPRRSGTAPGLICPRRQQGRLRRPGRALRDGRDVRPRPSCPTCAPGWPRRGRRASSPRRVLRTWGASESGLAESLQGRIDALDVDGATSPWPSWPRASRASRCGSRPGPARSAEVGALLDKEEVEVRRAIEAALGDIVFGVDDESMEVAVAARLVAKGLTFGVAESLTGGLIASRLVNVPGRLGLVPGRRRGLPRAGEVRRARRARGPGGHRGGGGGHGRGVRRVTRADVGLGITGVAGPDDQEGVAPGHDLRRAGPARSARP